MPDSSSTAGGTPHVNALIAETSPYLLQHAHNPVYWRPWGEDAFATARNEDKVVFLSVGYSTCYWCHVMERESFTDLAIAEMLNRWFVCIKVDREERPDVDDVYMAATQVVSGNGGWPMSVFLEPQGLKPFYAGTYFPPKDRYGRPGFASLLRGIQHAWREQRHEVEAQSQQIADAVAGILARKQPPVAIGEELVQAAIAEILARHDPVHGGFDGAAGGPKFPMPAYLDFLMDGGWHDQLVRQAVQLTLDRMALGGIFDQVGGGFHRYSTDERWVVPHFEKMLYDNAQLLRTYVRAFELTNDAFYARIAQRIADYVLREMRDDHGLFFSAQDAEVDGREGQNYLWTSDQVALAFVDHDADALVELARDVYGLNDKPNFADPHHPEAGQNHVLTMRQRTDGLALSLGMSVAELDSRIAHINAALLVSRHNRRQPRVDDKVLAGWNGLMIAALADVGRVLQQPWLVHASERAATELLDRMCKSGGELMRSLRTDRAHIAGFLEDYACLAHGFIAIARASGGSKWLQRAETIMESAHQRFWDSAYGGYFDVQVGHQELFVRTKGMHDGAFPSGNSIMLLNCLELLNATGELRWRNRFERTLGAMSASLQKHPAGSTVAILALHRWLSVRSNPASAAAPPRQALVDPNRDGSPVRVHAHFVQNLDDWKVVRLTLNIAEGWHVYAHDSTDAFRPLHVRPVDPSVEFAVRYPAGTLLVDSDPASPMIYSGEATIELRIRVIGDHMDIAATFQACTSNSCLAEELRTIRVKFPE